ncbi:MAG: hypothetical protein NWE87_04545 [Candidatus Bathyarchaeota archaeon]|nr:hypothetical protein [Candidatus Bathyarchaeota archaeon]
MDDVEVDVHQIAVIQVVGADAKMAVLTTDAHIPPTAVKLDLQLREYILRLLTEEASNSLNRLKALKILLEWIQHNLSIPPYPHIQLMTHNLTPYRRFTVKQRGL